MRPTMPADAINEAETHAADDAAFVFLGVSGDAAYMAADGLPQLLGLVRRSSTAR